MDLNSRRDSKNAFFLSIPVLPQCIYVLLRTTTKQLSNISELNNKSNNEYSLLKLIKLVKGLFWRSKYHGHKSLAWIGIILTLIDSLQVILLSKPSFEIN